MLSVKPIPKPMNPLFARWRRLLSAFTLVSSLTSPTLAQTTDPGLLLHFGVSVGAFAGGVATDASGKVKARVVGHPAKQKLGPSEGYRFDGTNDWLVVADDVATNQFTMPTRELTASAWVNLSETMQRGSIMGCISADRSSQGGWQLGYSSESFVFSLVTKGADGAKGRLSVLQGTNKIMTGKWYHVAATYDGRSTRLYVNGQLDGEMKNVSGEILYPEHAPFTIGCYANGRERRPMEGTLLEVKLHSRALADTVFANEAAAGARLISYDLPSTESQRFIAQPFLQWATQDGMTIVWETSRSGIGWVEYGEKLPYDQKTPEDAGGTMHEIRISGLKPETSYFYRVRTRNPDGTELVGQALTLQTAVRPESAFAFVAIGDTQRNRPVIKKLQDFAYSLRPNFEIHLGDVVDEGANKNEWVKEMLPASHSLMGRVPVFPSIGNHERNHSLYYQYFSLPEPEYHYTYSYGNAQFFVLDTNKSVEPGSDQYRWLDDELGKSKATWKFCYHHHTIWCSDEDDYGDTYKEKSTWGEPRHRHLAGLYEKHHVDMAFNGHVHAYERTWPIYQDKVDEQKGTIYITSGGGGGGLESVAPSRTWFQKRTYRGHHVTYVMIHDKSLQLQAFDLEGRLFDVMELKK